MDKLIKQAEELGIKVDKRWSEETLQSEIDKALAEKAAAEAEAKAREEAEAKEQAEREALEKAQAEAAEKAEAEAKAKQEAEEKAEAEAKAAREALEKEQAADSFVITSLVPNSMKVLGLEGYGEATITGAQMAVPAFAKKIERARQLGLIKVSK